MLITVPVSAPEKRFLHYARCDKKNNSAFFIAHGTETNRDASQGTKVDIARFISNDDEEETNFSLKKKGEIPRSEGARNAIG